MNIKVEVEKKQQSYRINIFGEVDAYTVEVLRAKLDEIKELNNNHFEVNLADVNYIDSTGLGTLVGFYKEVKKQEGTLKIVGLNERLNRLFEITGLSKVMEIERIGEK